MNLLSAIFFLAGIIFIWLLPVPVLYGFSDFIRFIVFRIFGYRLEVVKKNLKGSFPDKTEKELNKITQLFYKNLADIFIEGIWAFTMSKKQIRKRYHIINPEILEPFSNCDQSIIGVTGHYSNWEWGSLCANILTEFKIVAFYKRINNRYIDNLVKRNRSRFGTTLASINETSLTFEKYKGIKTIFLMAADQGMPKKFVDKAFWIFFLNRDTPFLHGMEKHSRQNNLPVIYLDVQRVKRGYYTVELSILTDRPLDLQVGKLTEMYARKLESVIIKKPENWLWSHRRWKLTR
jgi:KDO2-lipid IV(A) lauroyltransferase